MEPYPCRVWTYPTEFEFEGVVLTLGDREDEIKPGDTYIAGRNTGPHLLTAKEIHPRGWIYATDNKAYPFDTYECRKVMALNGVPI